MSVRWRWRSSATDGSLNVSILPAQSDQNGKRRRSSQGKSNRIASICMVSSTDTVSTQSNVRPTGKGIEQFGGVAADVVAQPRHLARGEGRGDGAARRDMLGRIHVDEIGEALVFGAIGDRDAAAIFMR